MNMPTLSTIILSAILAFGSAGIVLAQQAASSSDGMTAALDQPRVDNRITTRVRAELASQEGIRTADISVTTNDGVVTLAGLLENDTAVRKATAVAESVAGVRMVRAAGLKSRD